MNLIIENKELSDLHNKLLKSAKKYDKNMNTKYCGKNYLPHITHKTHPYPKNGEKYEITEIYIVEAISDKPMLRKVIKKFS